MVCLNKVWFINYLSSLSVLVLLIEFSFECLRISLSSVLCVLPFSFLVLVVEFLVHVVLIVHPCLNLMWIFFMEMSWGWSSVDKFVLAIVPNVVRGKAIIVPKHHLSPQVRMLSTFMHSSIWLECIFNVELVFVEHGINLSLRGLWVSEYFIKVSSDSILFIMEFIEVDSLDGINMLSH